MPVANIPQKRGGTGLENVLSVIRTTAGVAGAGLDIWERLEERARVRKEEQMAEDRAYVVQSRYNQQRQIGEQFVQDAENIQSFQELMQGIPVLVPGIDLANPIAQFNVHVADALMQRAEMLEPGSSASVGFLTLLNYEAGPQREHMRELWGRLKGVPTELVPDNARIDDVIMPEVLQQENIIQLMSSPAHLNAAKSIALAHYLGETGTFEGLAINAAVGDAMLGETAEKLGSEQNREAFTQMLMRQAYGDAMTVELPWIDENGIETVVSLPWGQQGEAAWSHYLALMRMREAASLDDEGESLAAMDLAAELRQRALHEQTKGIQIATNYQLPYDIAYSIAQGIIPQADSDTPPEIRAALERYAGVFQEWVVQEDMLRQVTVDKALVENDPIMAALRNFRSTYQNLGITDEEMRTDVGTFNMVVDMFPHLNRASLYARLKKEDPTLTDEQIDNLIASGNAGPPPLPHFLKHDEGVNFWRDVEHRIQPGSLPGLGTQEPEIEAEDILSQHQNHMDFLNRQAAVYKSSTDPDEQERIITLMRQMNIYTDDEINGAFGLTTTESGEAPAFNPLVHGG